MATGSDAPIGPVQLICETKPAGCAAGRREKTLSLEIGAKLAGLSAADAAALGLVEASDGLPDGASDGVPDGDAPVQPLTASTIAKPASLAVNCLEMAARSNMRADYRSALRPDCGEEISPWEPSRVAE